MRRALVISEELGLAGFVVAVFGHFGFEAEIAETIVEAIEFLEHNGDIEAIFIDTSEESSIDPVELAGRVAARWPAKRLFVSSERVDLLHVLPPCVFLGKPWSPRTLISVIEGAMRRRPTGH
jgi:CheY-like chemotaxis protein